MKTYLLIALGLIVVIALAVYVFPRTTTDTTRVTEELRTYQNAEFGYAVSYPARLTYREYSGGNVMFGTEDEEVMNGVAEVRVVTISANEGEDLQTAAARELQNLCAADGPTASFSCTGVERVQPFRTDTGTQGYMLYLRGELRDFATDEVTTSLKGPYIVFPLEVRATGGRAIIVHAPLAQSAENADAATIQDIARTLTISAPVAPNESIEAYIASRISTLSPQPEVLGGTFYVTAIEAQNGSGTVSYEDGHNAYTADFTYSVSQTGAISVDSFTVRN